MLQALLTRFAQVEFTDTQLGAFLGVFSLVLAISIWARRSQYDVKLVSGPVGLFLPLIIDAKELSFVCPVWWTLAVGTRTRNIFGICRTKV